MPQTQWNAFSGQLVLVDRLETSPRAPKTVHGVDSQDSQRAWNQNVEMHPTGFGRRYQHGRLPRGKLVPTYDKVGYHPRNKTIAFSVLGELIDKESPQTVAAADSMPTEARTMDHTNG